MAEVHPEPVIYVPPIRRTTHGTGYDTFKTEIMPCVVMCFMILLVILIPIILFVSAAMSNVKAPRLELDSLTVSNFNFSSRPNQISADWSVGMNFKNVDRHGYFEFSDSKVLIYYDDKIVGVTNLMSFNMSPKDPPMHVGGEFFSRLSGYFDDSMISDIAHNRNFTGTLIFSVEFSALVKKTYRGFWGTDWWDPYSWEYKCQNVELNFGSSDASKANILNGSRKCNKVSLPSSAS